MGQEVIFNPLAGGFDIIDTYNLNAVNTVAELPPNLIVPQKYQVTNDADQINNGEWILLGDVDTVGTGWKFLNAGEADITFPEGTFLKL